MCKGNVLLYVNHRITVSLHGELLFMLVTQWACRQWTQWTWTCPCFLLLMCQKYVLFFWSQSSGAFSIGYLFRFWFQILHFKSITNLPTYACRQWTQWAWTCSCFLLLMCHKYVLFFWSQSSGAFSIGYFFRFRFQIIHFKSITNLPTYACRQWTQWTWTFPCFLLLMCQKHVLFSGLRTLEHFLLDLNLKKIL